MYLNVCQGRKWGATLFTDCEHSSTHQQDYLSYSDLCLKSNRDQGWAALHISYEYSLYYLM